LSKKICAAFLAAAAMMILTACSASNDKIIEAQAKYRQLVTCHNQVMEAYAEIKDNTLDDELKVISDKIELIKSYNLYEMTDAEVDVLIEAMDTIYDSYSKYLSTIGEIKKAEDAEVLTPITFSLVNESDVTFTTLSLMEKGETDLVTNVLDTMSGLNPGQEIMGLTIYRDVDNTPWVLSLSTGSNDGEEVISTPGVAGVTEEVVDGNNDPENNYRYKLIINVENMPETGGKLCIKNDEETGEIYLE